MRSIDRRAFTLLEVSIAVAILAVVMTALLESWTGMARYATFASVQDDLTVEGQRIVREIQFDLSQSGWYLPDGTTASYTDDRNVRYYPYIQVQNPDGFVSPTTLGSKFKAHWRAMSTVRLTTPANLPGSPADFYDPTLTSTQYATSHYARSQEIIFLRVQSRAWGARPQQESLQTVNFSGDYTVANNHDALGIRRMADYKLGDQVDTAGRHYVLRGAKRIYDIAPSCLWMRMFNGEVSVPVLWEAMSNPPKLLPPTGSTASVVDPDDLREYTYCVVPSPTNDGHGQLVRAYLTATAAATDRVIPTLGATSTRKLVVDKVISDYVDRVTFDTFRTDRPDALTINQVRVRVFLSRIQRGANARPQARVIEAILALRTTTDLDATSALATALGSAGGEPLLE